MKTAPTGLELSADAPARARVPRQARQGQEISCGKGLDTAVDAGGDGVPREVAVRILMVEDDRDLVDLLTVALQRAGIETLTAFDPTMVHGHLRDTAVDLLLLDIDRAGSRRFHLLKEVRRKSEVPIIVLTWRDSEKDRVRALGLGADHYLTKPFCYRDLESRIRASCT